MERFSVTAETQFSSAEQEAAFLRERLKRLEEGIDSGADTLRHERPEEQLTRAYASVQPEKVLAKGHQMLKPEIDAVVLDLAPEEHDTVMSELLTLVREKGIRNALSVVEKLHDAHIEDDFHRFLAEYLKTGYPVSGIKEGDVLWKALHMTLLEVTLPFSAQEAREHQRPLKELLSSMEQFYAGALSTTAEKNAKKNYFTIELAVESHQEHIALFLSVPVEKVPLFERQLLSIFPQARIEVAKNDYNVFVPEGQVAGSTVSYSRPSAYSLKTHESFDYDPLNILLSSFAKLLKTGEGAAFQVLIRPAQTDYTGRFRKSLEKLSKGISVKEAFAQESLMSSIGKELNGLFFSSGKKEDTEKEKERVIDDIAIEQVKQKVAHPIVETNIRLVASATTMTRAEAILSDMEASLNQFEDPRGNALVCTRIKKNAFKVFIKNFSFRLFSESNVLPMNLREVASIIHLPTAGSDGSRELKRSKSGGAPAPMDLPTEGILLGHNTYGNKRTPIHMADVDRVRHLYVIGQTGTGKTTILKNMIVQDIKNGEGVCMIDPHGTDIQDILAQIPKERWDDVIYFDPAHTERPMGLNMLEYDTRYPEQKTFVVNELFSIFQKLYEADTMGPMFEQYFRNATLLVIEDPNSGNTLADVSRVLSDPAFRELKLARCKNPIVVQFWRDVAEKAGGESSLVNMVPYITSKFDVFLANDFMRPIITQRTSAFNFRQIMDERKILLVNLSKGRLGDINANLIGLIIVGKILMAALSRVDVLGRGEVHPFYLYIDEFQNVTTDSISTILSEARKYKLGLIVAHQFIKQLPDKIRDAIFGNVGSLCAFRVGSEDAEFLEKQFTPVFSATDLMNIDNFNAVIKMLANNKPVRPFNLQIEKPAEGNIDVTDRLKELSYVRYGRPRAEIEAQVSTTHTGFGNS